MHIFRYLLTVAVAILLLALNPSTGKSWEFNLSGSLVWTYEMYSQQGRSGFFGPYDSDASASSTTNSAANLNLWNGIDRAFNVQMASGSDVSVSYLIGDFWPTVKINPAIDIRGRLRIAGTGGNYNWSSDSAYQYRTWSNPGTLNNMGIYWPMLWGTARTPWGTVSYGKRPMAFGTGLQYDGDSNITNESLMLKTFYGPISIALGFYPYRQAPNNSFSQGSGSLWWPPGPPNPIMSTSTDSYSQYYNTGDKSGIRKLDLCWAVVYSSGNLELGLYESYFSYHIGPESVLRNGYPIVYLPRNTDVSNGTLYAKYSNGTIFVNAEAAWLFGTSKYNTTQNPTYVDQSRYIAEFGVISGPAKISFLFGYSPGLDRRKGAYIDKQPAGFLREKELTRELAGISLWRQYAYLMPYVYGTGLAGNQQETLSGPGYQIQFSDYRFNQGLNQEGSVLDALVLATRLDYSIASNLNVFGGLFWAQRTSVSYPWGFISPEYFASSGDPSARYTGNVMINLYSNPASPSIPDPALGYEVDLGLAWKLLENWKVEAMVCRWQPGKWFNYACVDKSVPAWRTPTASNNYGTNPGRTVDAIIGVRVDLTSSF